MEVTLQCNGLCWNNIVLQEFAANDEDKVSQKLESNPDVLARVGKIACSGHEDRPLEGKTFCTARVTPTQYAIKGEIPPRPEDAYLYIKEVPGFELTVPLEQASSN